MKICVLVKQVPDHEAVIRVGEDGSLEVEDRYVTNFFDEIAVEQAILLRESQGGTVTAVSAGGGRNVDALRRALAMGADAAVMVDDPALADADGLGLARALDACLGTLEPDLVLAGRVGLDDEMGLVGPAVAELLGWAHLAGVVGLDLDGETFTAIRLVEGARETVAGRLPALLTCSKGLAEPRVPKVMQVMKASRARIDTRDLASLGVDPAAVAPLIRVAGHTPPPGRAAVRMIEGDLPEQVQALASILLVSAGGTS
ncbi:MAG: electron transfer flavoprotein subunit beta/FixA family protein [Deltaproteobacteria bacterium]|nr:electron transfer flavoprotein subunit beta/FixA family protein [Deltaproteobacteria bacterium]